MNIYYGLNRVNASNLVIDIESKLGVQQGDLVEILPTPDSSGIIIKKVLTSSEKIKNWKAEEIKKIPPYALFVKDGKTVICYYQYEGKQRCGFSVYSPNDEFDFELSKVIAWTRAEGRTLPNFIYD